MTINVYIDGDWIVYAAGFAGEKTQYMIEGDATVYESAAQITEAYGSKKPQADAIFRRVVIDPLEHVLHSANMMLESALYELSNKTGEKLCVKLVLSPRKVANFRDSVATIRPYKGNREAARKPVYFKELMDHLSRKQGVDIIEVSQDESDDVISILAHTRLATSGPKSYIIVGIDKDLRQIPGFHYHPREKTLTKVTPYNGKVFLCRQALIGDPVDNIGGAYKVGPKAAEQIIVPGMSDEDMWTAVVTAYEDTTEKYSDKILYAGLDGESAALENMRLVRLQHPLDGNSLWTPPYIWPK